MEKVMESVTVYDHSSAVIDFMKLHMGSMYDWNTLEHATELVGITYAKGSRFKCFESTDFGWIWFEVGTKDINGNDATIRIIKY